MNKNEFLSSLCERLHGLPEKDIEKSADYYSEMIDDRIEDGLSEEEAVRAVGPVDEIVSQIFSETSLPKLVKANIRPRRSLKALEITMLILGSPLWLSFLLIAAMMVLCCYLILFAGITVMYSTVLIFASGALTSVFALIIKIFSGGIAEAVFYLGAALACSGLTILLFFGSNRITKGFFNLNRRFFSSFRSRLIRKETMIENENN